MDKSLVKECGMTENNDKRQDQNTGEERSERIKALAGLIYTAENILSETSISPLDFINNLSDSYIKRKKKKQLKELAPMAKSASGGVTGPIILVLGLIFLSAAVLFILIPYFQYSKILPWQMIFAALFLVLSLFFIIYGERSRRHAEIFSYYKKAFGEKPYAKVSTLAQASGQSVKSTIKSLTNYQDEGLYPQGRFTNNKKYYVLSQGGMEILEEKLKKEASKRQKEAYEKAFEKTYPKLYAVNREIEDTITTINDLRNDNAIRNPELKEELGITLELLGNIETFILENPEEVPEVKSFLDYFLPTTTKLLTTYSELEKEKVQTKNVKESKEQIESVIVSINKAFEKLYDDFYTGTAIDVYSDVSVLNTMIAQQGLAEKDFNNKE